MREETIKMIEKIEPLIDKIETKDRKGEEMMENMKAYISDSKHFLKNKNYLKSFEAIVFAYGILETCEELGVFKLER
jgi:hypothetical protein